MQPNPYFFAPLFSKELPAQTQTLREMLYPRSGLFRRKPDYPGDDAVVAEMLHFLEKEASLEPESAIFMTIAPLPSYGSENYGLYNGNMTPIVRVLTWLRERFPGHPHLGFKLSDAMLMAGDPPESWYPILQAAIRADTGSWVTLPPEIYESLHVSPYSFDFDLLMLEHYGPRGCEAAFEEDREALLSVYTSSEQTLIIQNLKWKNGEGNSC